MPPNDVFASLPDAALEGKPPYSSGIISTGVVSLQLTQDGILVSENDWVVRRRLIGKPPPLRCALLKLDDDKPAYFLADQKTPFVKIGPRLYVNLVKASYHDISHLLGSEPLGGQRRTLASILLLGAAWLALAILSGWSLGFWLWGTAGLLTGLSAIIASHLRDGLGNTVCVYIIGGATEAFQSVEKALSSPSCWSTHDVKKDASWKIYGQQYLFNRPVLRLVDRGGENLLFLPDRLCSFDEGILPYSRLSVRMNTRQGASRFPPSDAKVLRKEWKHANKDGSPDRRRKENYEIINYQYDEVSITARGIEEINLGFSKPGVAERVVTALEHIKQTSTHRSKQPQSRAKNDSISNHDEVAPKKTLKNSLGGYTGVASDTPVGKDAPIEKTGFNEIAPSFLRTVNKMVMPNLPYSRDQGIYEEQESLFSLWHAVSQKHYFAFNLVMESEGEVQIYVGYYSDNSRRDPEFRAQVAAILDGSDEAVTIAGLSFRFVSDEYLALESTCSVQLQELQEDEKQRYWAGNYLALIEETWPLIRNK